MKLTPRQAIKKECKWCAGYTPDNCNTTICQLSNLFEYPSALQRIKAHCLDCAAQDIHETKPQAVKACKGDLLRENNNTERWTDKDGVTRGVCFLHPYRFGKNPERKKRTLTPEQTEKRLAALKKGRAKLCARPHKSTPESIVLCPAIPLPTQGVSLMSAISAKLAELNREIHKHNGEWLNERLNNRGLKPPNTHDNAATTRF